MLIISCSHGGHLGRRTAKKSGLHHSRIIADKFPDNELRVKFNIDLKNHVVALVQSFYGNISDCIIEVVLAAKTAKELEARKIILLAPYFPYMRQDKRFNSGEAISQEIIAELIGNYFDSVYLIDPHLHRTKRLENVFKIKSYNLSAASLIADYIKNNIKNPVIIGPDEESNKWAKNVAEKLKVDFRILKKKRYSSYHVEVKLDKKINLKNKNAVIVDDIVSTGHTIIEASKTLNRLGAKKIYCLCVHGIFADNALSRLNNAGIEVISTNTIPSKAAKIDVSGILSSALHVN